MKRAIRSPSYRLPRPIISCDKSSAPCPAKKSLVSSSAVIRLYGGDSEGFRAIHTISISLAELISKPREATPLLLRPLARPHASPLRSLSLSASDMSAVNETISSNVATVLPQGAGYGVGACLAITNLAQSNPLITTLRSTVVGEQHLPSLGQSIHR